MTRKRTKMTTRRDKNSTIDNIGFFSPSGAKKVAVSWFSSLTKCQRRLLTASEITLLKTVNFHRVSGFNICDLQISVRGRLRLRVSVHTSSCSQQGIVGCRTSLLVIRETLGTNDIKHVLYMKSPRFPKIPLLHV